MKIYLLKCFSLLCFFVSSGQSYGQDQVKWGATVSDKTGGMTSERRFIGSDDFGSFILHRNYSSKSYYIEHYNYENALVFASKLVLPNKDKATIEKVELYQDKLVLITSAFNSASKTSEIGLYQVSKGDGSILPDKHIVATLNADGAKNYTSYISVSPDQSKLVVLISAPNKATKEKIFSLALINPSLKASWTKEIRLSEKYKDAVVEKFKSDNAGNAHVLLSREKSGKETKSGDQKVGYAVVSYNSEKDFMRELALEVPEKFIYSIDLETNTANNLTVVGLIGTSKESGVKSTAYWQLGTDSKNFDKQLESQIPEKFLIDYNTPRGYKYPGQKGIDDLHIRKIVFTDNSNIFVLTEREYVLAQEMNNGSSITNRIFASIFVLDLKDSGEIRWVKKVPKYQGFGSYHLRYWSFVSFLNNGKLNIVFNDNPKNIDEYENEERVGSLEKAIVCLVTIDTDGKVVFSNV